jgi:hypothetical protein
MKQSNVQKTKFNVSKFKEPEFYKNDTGLLRETVSSLKEAYENDDQYGNVFKEKFGETFKEDVNTTTADGAYTTMLSSIMQTALVQDEELQKIMSLVFVNDDMVKATGYGAYKIPKLEPTIAVEVAEGQVINYFDEGIDSGVYEPKKYVTGTKITWEIRKRGMNNLVQWVLNNAKDAIVRKRISNIVNGLAAGAGNTVSGGISFANFVDARKAVRSAEAANGAKLGFVPDKFVVSSDNFGTLLQDETFLKAMFPANANPGYKPADTGVQMPYRALNCEIIETPYLTGAQALVLDSKKAAMWLKESELQFFEGRLPQSPDTEILALESGVLAVLYTDAVAKITS